MERKESVSCVTREASDIYSPELHNRHLRLSGLTEISLVLKGCGIHLAPGEAEECQEGDLFVSDSGLPNAFFAKSSDERPTVCTLAFDTAEFLDQPYSQRGSGVYCYGVFRNRRPSSYAMLNAKAYGKVRAVLASIDEELQNRDSDWTSAVKAYVAVLMVTISRYLMLADTVSSECGLTNPKDWPIVSLAMQKVMDNFSDTSITLDSIAGELFVSSSHLSRIFRKVTGSSFKDYVREIRLEHACRLLAATRLSNEDIVLKCGLKDIPSFYRLFKIYMGMTPYQYRMNKHSQKGEQIMSIYTEISENIQRGKAKAAAELVSKAIADGLPAGQILYDGLLAGMSVIGEKFKNNQVYVPEVLIAARAMNTGIQLLKPILQEDGVKAVGKVCIGTVQGDLHDIGKNLVKMMMEGKGLEVIDLGTDVAPKTFIQTAIDENCQVICCSALLTTTQHVMGDVVKEAEAAGIRDKVKIMIGGAPITEEFCRAIGADCYTSDAASAADAAVELCKA